jgi:hypothetical protein
MERFRASLGQIFYFEDRQVTSSRTVTADDVHKTSAFAGQIGATISTALVFYTSATWDPNDGQLNEIGSTLQYRADNRHIINLSYRRRDDIQPLLKQTDASFYWSIFRQYALIGRFDYDLEEHRTIEALAGLSTVIAACRSGSWGGSSVDAREHGYAGRTVRRGNFHSSRLQGSGQPRGTDRFDDAFRHPRITSGGVLMSLSGGYAGC